MVCCFGAKLDLLKTIKTANWCILVITPVSKIGENIIAHNYRLNKYIANGQIYTGLVSLTCECKIRNSNL